MVRPEDIPQDVWEATNRIWLANPNAGGVEITARAIMAAKAEERQSAAKRYRDGAGPDTWDFFGEAENAILSDR